jgi:hypothetical protein
MPCFLERPKSFSDQANQASLRVERSLIRLRVAHCCPICYFAEHASQGSDVPEIHIPLLRIDIVAVVVVQTHDAKNRSLSVQ